MNLGSRDHNLKEIFLKKSFGMVEMNCSSGKLYEAAAHPLFV